MGKQQVFEIGGDNEGWSAALCLRGAGFLHITPTGQERITREGPPADKMECGRQGGGFWTFGQFARAEGRKILWRDGEYTLPWVQQDREGEINALHGAEPWLDFKVISFGKNFVELFLPADALPNDYPFPHGSNLFVEIDGPCLTMIGTYVNTTDFDHPANPVWHPFYRYRRGGVPMRFSADVTHRFEYADDAALPHATTAPVARENFFANGRTLSTGLDHSFRYGGRHRFGWGTDEFDVISTRRHLQVWTTAHDQGEDGVCAVEPTAGPANGPWLAANGLIPESELFVVPGEDSKSHTVIIERL